MLNIIFIISLSVLALRRLLTYLHIFQQQEYDNRRFLVWIFFNKAIDKRLTSIICVLTLIFYVINNFLAQSLYTAWIDTWVEDAYISIGFVVAISIISYIENNPLKRAKKKLIMTNRAKRIYYVSLIINLLNNISINFIFLKNINFMPLYLQLFFQVLVAVHFMPIYLIFSNWLLSPIEKRIQQTFWQQAKQKINTYKPFIIGITGSFGKTSVKHFLGHILQHADHTLITPGSINTSMGISRIIREQLNKAHRYFVVEMGAYGVGSIADLCKLTVPNLGIITSIGMAHYERFKTLETVAKAKFELAESVINNGKQDQNNINPKVIIPEQVLNTNYAKNYVNQHQESFSILKELQLTNVTQLKTGLAITLNWQNVTYDVEVPVFGVHHATNIALAWQAACTLRINTEIIIAALKTMPQISHRLEVRKQNECVIIDDAYNANPSGFRSGLELLNFLHQPPGRRILVTPGLIELGKAHEMEHLMLGRDSAVFTDIALVVKPNRINSFVDGFNERSTEHQQIIKVESFAEAKDWLNKHSRLNDTILFANDLPDLYEVGLLI